MTRKQTNSALFARPRRRAVDTLGSITFGAAATVSGRTVRENTVVPEGVTVTKCPPGAAHGAIGNFPQRISRWSGRGNYDVQVSDRGQAERRTGLAR